MGFRKILNRAFGNRDLRVSYRIGTRRYGWGQAEQLEIHGSEARLEERRDYLLIDMDQLFRRKETEKGWLFKRFAGDAFARRVKHFLRPQDLSKKRERTLAAQAFGPSPTPTQLADYFGQAASVKIERALAIEDSETESQKWSQAWRDLLRAIYAESPLEGVLAAAWGRQTGGGSSSREHREDPPPSDRPWNNSWWRKERLMQAVLQLAARRQQRLLWWGYADVLALSGSNITIFIHICHEVWDQFLKEQRLLEDDKRSNPLSGDVIGKTTQAVAIQTASAVWHRKLAEQPGGDIRRRFIDELGKHLRRHLREDKSMSYPGANGFSLAVQELTKRQSPHQEVFRFLQEAVGFGDLYEVQHTTKHKTGEPRLKYYLNPILSPAFQIPAAHTKEPLYWRIEDVLKLANRAQLPFGLKAEGSSSSNPVDQQLPLFSAL